ncbi:hypothetical protein M378DRAFT_656575 [Amanita muscaria Koide BX008]|uniref:Protein kinase domain-containing protein n=1 Tax=Amanita muscaria (strain Koide BX008) TaxID=946122 RepID=A0A0C2X4T4_AMAMK|nr:hypothetical protein M378DRAFT_656575 [Amanita muscaria Koide BX008]
MFISRILDHNYIVPLLGKYDEKNDQLRFVRGNATGQYESVDEWLRESTPKLVTRIRVMLEVARTIRYIHSMDIVLYSHFIRSGHLFLDSNLRTKILFFGLFAWWHREASIYGYEDSGLLGECTYESNIFAFGKLFRLVCFEDGNSVIKQYFLPNHVNARRLIGRCHAKDLKSRPTMEDVVKEMETWNFS